MPQEHQKGCKKNTYVLGRGAHDWCTDEATRRIARYRNNAGGEGKKDENKAKTEENLTQGVDSHTAPRLCSKAEPGTLPHDLPSPLYSRRQRVSNTSIAAVEPPPPGAHVNKKKTQN